VQGSATPGAKSKSISASYALAVGAAIAALMFRRILEPWLGLNNPYHTVWLAVVFSAWYCGLGPSILATLISGLGVWYWFLPPVGSFAVENAPTTISGMVGFLFFSSFIIALGEANRRSRSRLQSEIADRITVEQNLRVTERALRQSEERLRIAQKAARSGTWESKYEPRELITSPELRELYGLPPDTDRLDGGSFRQMINAEDLQNVDSVLAQAIASHSGDLRIEFRITRLDGALRWVESVARIFYHENGKPDRIIGVATDITERKQSEGQRQQITAEAIAATAKFRAVFEQTSVFAGILTLDGKVIDANRLCLDVCGYRAEDILGRYFWETGWWRDSKEVQEKIRAGTVQAARGTAYREILPYRWADGTERIVEFELHPIRDHHGLVIFLHPTGVDITDVKRVEAELRKSHEGLEKRVEERTRALNASLVSLESEIERRKKTEFVLRELSARSLRLQDEERRRIARDLHDSTGQTLVALRMMLDSLSKVVASVPKAGELLQELESLSNQALQEIRVTSHLLHPPLLDEVGFSSAAQWYVEGFTKRSGVKANLELAATPQLTKDEELVFFRILQESLTNVLRHSGSEAVDIQVTADDRNAMLSIRDFGRGIPFDKLSSFQEIGAGVGVGLGGMKQRIRNLGGHLTVSSDGTGTCVLATLPLADADPVNAEPSVAEAPNAESPGQEATGEGSDDADAEDINSDLPAPAA